MQKLKNALVIGSISLLLGIATTSCQKDEPQPIEESEKQRQYDIKEILTLKTYYAELVNVEVKQIEFDGKRGVFLIFGNDQLTIDQLREFYKISKGE